MDQVLRIQATDAKRVRCDGIQSHHHTVRKRQQTSKRSHVGIYPYTETRNDTHSHYPPNMSTGTGGERYKGSLHGPGTIEHASGKVRKDSSTDPAYRDSLTSTPANDAGCGELKASGGTFRPPGGTFGPPGGTFGSPGGTFGPLGGTFGPPGGTFEPYNSDYKTASDNSIETSGGELEDSNAGNVDTYGVENNADSVLERSQGSTADRHASEDNRAEDTSCLYMRPATEHALRVNTTSATRIRQNNIHGDMQKRSKRAHASEPAFDDILLQVQVLYTVARNIQDQIHVLRQRTEGPSARSTGTAGSGNDTTKPIMSTEHQLYAFVEDRLKKCNWGGKVRCGEVRRAYVAWWESNKSGTGENMMSHIAFAREMTKHWHRQGVQRRYYMDLLLRKPVEAVKPASKAIEHSPRQTASGLLTYQRTT
jgi:hypothetical protein